MDDVFIDLDHQAASGTADGSRVRGAVAGPAGARRATPLTRAAVLLALGLAATMPPGAPSATSMGRAVPLPSYCTGTPIPGGRLNILHGRDFVIFDATTNTVVNEGRCPLHTAGN